MPTIVTTNHGAVKRLRVDGTVVDMGCPPNSIFTNRIPSWRQYKGRAYGVGAWDRGIMISEFKKSYTIGLKTPTVAPTLALGAAGSIKSGGSIAYYSLLHKVYDLVLDESALSPASATVTPTGHRLAISAVPTSFPMDAKATHWRYYRSDNGGAPRRVADIAIGTATYDDNITTLALGVAAELVERGPVPVGVRYNEVYGERMWYSGDPAHPERIYYSKIGEPQSVGSASYLETREGEAVLGLARNRDQLMIGCANCFYAVTVRGTDNFVVEKISPTIGLLSHFSMVDIHGRLWFASLEGVYVYDGSFKLVSRDIWHLWRQEYQATAQAFHEMQAIHDEYRKIYKLLYRKSPSANVQTRYFCGNYSSFEPIVAADQNSQPDWTMDFRARRDSAMGLVSFGNGPQSVMTGSCDGKVRKENNESDDDDDSDGYNKDMYLQTGAEFLGVPAGGNDEDGHTITKFWLYFMSENSPWMLKLVGGDEDAISVTSFTYEHDMTGSADAGFVAKTIHFFTPEKISGRGFVMQLYAQRPIRVAFRGFGHVSGPGPATRPDIASE